jgi:hypothetical protein
MSIAFDLDRYGRPEGSGEGKSRNSFTENRVAGMNHERMPIALNLQSLYKGKRSLDLYSLTLDFDHELQSNKKTVK